MLGLLHYLIITCMRVSRLIMNLYNSDEWYIIYSGRKTELPLGLLQPVCKVESLAVSNL